MLYDHLEKLLAFKTIADCGSIRKAADVVGVAQPALTRSIHVLEGDLRVQLFKRSVRGVILTREGHLLFDYATRILKAAEDVQAQMKASANEVSGVVTIGTFASISVYLWPKILGHLRMSFPRLQIRLKTQDEDHIENLAKGLLDLVVDAEPRRHPNLASVLLYRDRFNFYANSDAPSASLPFIYVAESYDENGMTIADFLRESGRQNFHSPYELDSFETVKALAVEGIGIGIMPERVAKDAVERKLLSRIPMKPFSSSGFGSHKICATIREEDKNDHRISALVREMKSLLGRALST